MPCLRPLVLAILAFCGLAIPSIAQNYVATQPDNTLTPADPIGMTPTVSTAGTFEAVNNMNGGLSFFLPVLSLPQRGGWNLSLGYYNTSPQSSVRQDVSITEEVNDGVGQTFLTYNDNVLPTQTGPLLLNFPTLQASIEYTGDVTINNNEYPTLCLTNWQFTDWSGTKHQFTNVTVCSVSNLGEAASDLAQITDASDGSWLRLNTTNYATTGITVTTKNGTVYTFPPFASGTFPYTPCAPPNIGCPSSLSTLTYANPRYDSMFSTMVDSNGNTVNLAPASGQGLPFLCGVCTLTDTINRTIQISGESISYYDSGAHLQTVEVNSTLQSAQTYNFNGFACSEGKPPQNVFVTVETGQTQFTTLQPSTYTVSFPAVGGTSRVYTLQFDGLNNLTQITYPGGGYMKYVFPYSNNPPFFHLNYALVGCSQPQQEISQKRECPAGGCTSAEELVTTYTPTPDLAWPFNDSIAISDPLGDTSVLYFQNMAAPQPYLAPHEVASYIYAPGQYTPCSNTPPCGTPMRGTATSFNTYVGGVDVQVPSQIVTTLYDTQPNLSATTKYQYSETVPMNFWLIGNGGGGTVAINNATEIDEYDFAVSGVGNELRETAQTWMGSSNGNSYSISGGHLMDRLATRTVTDPASSVQQTLSYGYTAGNITSKVVGGTGVSSLTTSYQRDSFGNITQATDPKTNVTKFNYDWGAQTCGPQSLGDSAYLVSITDALTNVTKFSYFPCTGMKASITDPNNQTTSYTYDALGRLVLTTRPDNGTTSDQYADTIPNSVTVSSSITLSTNKAQTTTTDGFGRNVETELTTDPDSPDYVVTTYDALGRVSQRYNSTRCSAPTTNCGESTWGYTTFQYDTLDRTVQVTEPDGSIVTTAYSGNLTTVTDEAGKKQKTENDALGRLTNVWEDPSGLDYLTTYTNDAFGNLTKVVQNGQRQRTFQFNAFSQVISGTNPENNTVTYTYDNDGNVATKTSYAENQTNSTATPGTGSVTIGGSAECQGSTCDTGTIYITVNGYQVSTSYGNSTASSLASALASQLNSSASPVTATAPSNIISITSKATGPSANYSLSTSVTNSNHNFPRAAFTATASGSTLTGGSTPPTVTITYTYDALNRMIGKTYTDGTPTVTYWYDGSTVTGCSAPTLSPSDSIYHRSATCDGLGWEVWSYDLMGRVLKDERNTSGITETTAYVYFPYVDGSIYQMTYPVSNRTITLTTGRAGLPTSAVDSQNSINYATNAHYAPNGALAFVQSGSNLVTTEIYNSRQQPCWIYATTSTAQPAWNTAQCNTTDPGPATILDLQYNVNLGATDNGNIAGVTNNRDATRSQKFVYDSLNRISVGGTVNTSGSNCWGESFGIDAWANLYSRALPTAYSTSCASEVPFNYTVGNSNQLPTSAGFTYDAAGNLMSTGSGSYMYNGDEMMKSETTGGSTVTYSYDGDGRRIQKSNGTIYWYGANGAVLDETSLSGSLISEYIYFGSRRIARRDSSSNVFYYVGDHLGTSRDIVQAGQTTACYDADFFPYGGEIAPHANSCPQNYKFTGKERDAETSNGASSGLDYFETRHNNSNFGRFMSPDQGRLLPVDPQSLNRYTYTRNNPLTFVDPTGRYFVVSAEIHDQVREFLSTLLRSEAGRNLVNQIANSPKETLMDPGKLPVTTQTVQGKTVTSITNGSTEVIAGEPGTFAGVDIKLDFANIKLTAADDSEGAFGVGLTATTHELFHDADVDAASTFQAAAAAGVSGDAPSKPGMADTSGGTAQARALAIVKGLGKNGKRYRPDPTADAEADAIIAIGRIIQNTHNAASGIVQEPELAGCLVNVGANCDPPTSTTPASQ